MKSKWEKQLNSNGKLTVTLEGEEWSKAQDKALEKIARKVKIDGFRDGQAPVEMVRKRVGDQEIFFEAVDAIANEALLFGIKENDLTLVARPTLDIESMTKDQAVLTFACTVSPDVTLGDYKGIEYEEEKAKVTADEIKAQLESIQRQFTEQVVKEGEVAKGDVVVIDFEGFKDGVAFDGGKAENYSLEIGSGTFIPGFEDQLIGKKAGEELDVNVTFPEDYHEKSLAGAPVVFKVKVNEVKENVIPELNDDLAKDLDQEGIETLKDLEKRIKDDLTKQKERDIDMRVKDDLVRQVTENATVEIPQAMIDSEKEYMLNDMKQRIASQGIPFDQYLKFTGQTEEAMKEELGKTAPERVKSRLVLNQIALEEKLEATEEELAKEYEEIANNARMEVEKVKQLINEEDLKYDLTLNKALDFIKEQAKPKPSKKKENKEEKEDA